MTKEHKILAGVLAVIGIAVLIYLNRKSTVEQVASDVADNTNTPDVGSMFQPYPTAGVEKFKAGDVTLGAPSLNLTYNFPPAGHDGIDTTPQNDAGGCSGDCKGCCNSCGNQVALLPAPIKPRPVAIDAAANNLLSTGILRTIGG